MSAQCLLVNQVNQPLPRIKAMAVDVTDTECAASTVPPYTRALVHLLGVFALFFMITASVLPAYHFGLEVSPDSQND